MERRNSKNAGFPEVRIMQVPKILYADACRCRYRGRENYFLEGCGADSTGL